MSDTAIIHPGRLYLRDITPENHQPEVFSASPEHGFGFYDQQMVSRFASKVAEHVADHPLQDREVWLPTDTEVSADLIDQGRSVLLEGDLGAGKSAVLFGLRFERRKREAGYAFIDGHRDKASVQRVGKVLDWALSKDVPVFWDSFDYLVHKSKRQVSARTPKVIEAVNGFLDVGGQLIATTHTSPWLEKNGKANLIDDWQAVTEQLSPHRVWGLWDNPVHIAKFCMNAGIKLESAAAFASFNDHDSAFSVWLESTDMNDRKRAEVRQSLSQYRTIRLLLGIDDGRWKELIDNMPATAEMYADLAQSILAINAETRSKMRAPDDYALTPGEYLTQAALTGYNREVTRDSAQLANMQG